MKINARAVLVLPWLVLVALTIRDGPFRDFYRSTRARRRAHCRLAQRRRRILIAAREHAEQRVFGSSDVATRGA
jgi:hypothetical protein